MRSSVARCARRIVRVVGPVSAVILAGVTTAQAQAVPRQAPPPNSPARASQSPAQATTPPATTGQPAPAGAANIKPVSEAVPVEPAPILNFGAEGVSLEEALRLTLRHDPNIHLSAASADRLAGFAQEQSGIFDTAITGGVEYSYRVSGADRIAQGRRAQQAAQAR